LFTDVVDSTSLAGRLGDAAWRDALSSHFEMTRSQLENFGGREIDTTGDGMLATFDGPAQAVRCAATISRVAREQGLHIRAVFTSVRWKSWAATYAGSPFTKRRA
jgi:class 3 adenylate cyclase